jgi:hypothetical protein
MLVISIYQMFHQFGGGNCGLCRSPNTNKSTCPCNLNVIRPNYEKHPRWIEVCPMVKSTKVPSTKQVSPPKPKVSPPKPKVSPPKPKNPPKPKRRSMPENILDQVIYKGFTRDYPELIEYVVINKDIDTPSNNFMKIFTAMYNKYNQLNDDDLNKIRGFFERDLQNHSDLWIKAAGPRIKKYIENLFIEAIKTTPGIPIEDTIAHMTSKIYDEFDPAKFGMDDIILNNFYTIFDINKNSLDFINTIKHIYLPSVVRDLILKYDGKEQDRKYKEEDRKYKEEETRRKEEETRRKEEKTRRKEEARRKEEERRKRSGTDYGTEYGYGPGYYRTSYSKPPKPEPYDPNTLNEQEIMLLENYVTNQFYKEGGNTTAYRKLSFKFHPDKCITKPFEIPGFKIDKFRRIPDKVCNVLMGKLSNLKSKS